MFQHAFSTCETLVKHSDVPWRVRTSTLLKIRVAWGVRYAPLANGADKQQRQPLAIVSVLQPKLRGTYAQYLV